MYTSLVHSNNLKNTNIISCSFPKTACNKISWQTISSIGATINVANQHVNITVIALLSNVQQLIKIL